MDINDTITNRVRSDDSLATEISRESFLKLVIEIMAFRGAQLTCDLAGLVWEDMTDDEQFDASSGVIEACVSMALRTLDGEGFDVNLIKEMFNGRTEKFS